MLDILLEDDDQDDKDVVGTEVSLISWGGYGRVGQRKLDRIKGTAGIMGIQ